MARTQYLQIRISCVASFDATHFVNPESLRQSLAMYYNEHNLPHFHARYNEFKATISIKDLALLNGKLPPKVLGLVVEWATQHQQELLDDWELAR